MGKERIAHLNSTACYLKIENLTKINQFEQNEKFTPYLFKNNMFEGKFILDDKCKVQKYIIRDT